MKALSWIIGDCKITSIVEILDAGKIIQETIPQATPQNVLLIDWLQPDFSDSTGHLKAVVQAFVVQTPSYTILVDTCVGNAKPRSDLSAWGNLQTDFLQTLAAEGYPRESIDTVLCTHMHFDHVGWNTMMMDGRWIPTFSKAHYLFNRDEYNYWRERPAKEIADDHAGFADSVRPIFEAGLAKLVDANHEIGAGVSLIPTPGHTPGHVCLLVESQGESAVIAGDAFHHPCQIARPDWSTLADYDQAQSCVSRDMLLGRFCNQPTLIMSAHFAAPAAGKIVQENGSYFLSC